MCHSSHRSRGTLVVPVVQSVRCVYLCVCGFSQKRFLHLRFHGVLNSNDDNNNNKHIYQTRKITENCHESVYTVTSNVNHQRIITVFSNCLNSVSDSSGSRSRGGRAFQAAGAA